MAIAVGDRVGYSAHFVAGPGGHLKTIADRRGEIVSVDEGRPFCVVRWDDADGDQRAHISNIARVGSAAFGDPTIKPR
jgi:hypothetical protein